jgi:hypothetical protein
MMVVWGKGVMAIRFTMGLGVDGYSLVGLRLIVGLFFGLYKGWFDSLVSTRN